MVELSMKTLSHTFLYYIKEKKIDIYYFYIHWKFLNDIVMLDKISAQIKKETYYEYKLSPLLNKYLISSNKRRPVSYWSK